MLTRAPNVGELLTGPDGRRYQVTSATMVDGGLNLVLDAVHYEVTIERVCDETFMNDWSIPIPNISTKGPQSKTERFRR